MRAFVFLLGLLLASCTASLTELVVVIDTDYAIPSELDDVEIVVTEPDGMTETVVASLSETPLPISLGVVHRGGALDPLRIVARGRSSGVTRVHREVTTGFVQGETREVRLDLLRICAGDPCGVELSCLHGTCVSEAVPASALPRFGGVTRLDASAADVGADAGFEADGGFDASMDGGFDASMDAGIDAGLPDGGEMDAGSDACVAAPVEACDGRDQDCDGLVDEGACTCDPPCALDHAIALCTVTRTCAISSCETGYSNCDTLQETGCERSIRTLSDCGSCGRSCTSTAGTTTCADGTCRIVTCSDSRYRDCNGEVSDGCETRVDNDANNCGGCMNVCPTGTPRCSLGVCR